MRLARFAAVGVAATAVDVVGLLALREGARWPLLAADAAAVASAATASFLLNRHVTFAGEPRMRWVDRPGALAATAAVGGAVDVAVLSVSSQLFVGRGPWALLAAKAPALTIAAAVRLVGYRRLLFADTRRTQNERVERGPAPGAFRFSVIVPAFHEAERIAQTVGRLRSVLAPALGDGEYEVVVVDDGSDDDTATVARGAGAHQVVVLAANRGKGAAVRAGMAAARGRAVAFTDADLSYAPEQLLSLLVEVEAGWDVAVGRRHLDGEAPVPTSQLRELSSRAFNLLSQAVLLGQYRDTQCGLKAFRSDAAGALFAASRLDRFAFDVELFHLIERYRFSLVEVPVTVVNSAHSSVHVAVDSVRMIRDVLRVRRWSRQGRYDRSSAAVQSSVAPQLG